MKVCITGANGFIGKALVKRVLNEFEHINILTRKNVFEITSPKITLFPDDLTIKPSRLSLFVENCDIVFHCAGELHNKAQMRAVHVDGTKNLINALLFEASQKNKTIHFVQLSSVGVYGKADGGASQDRVVTENSPLNPSGEYETTKSESDLVLINTNRSSHLSYSILRPSNVIGPDMPNKSFYKMADMIRRRLFFYIGKPQAVATYIHIDDVVDALFLLATHPKSKGRIYNLSNDCPFEEVIEGIARTFNVPLPKWRASEFWARFLVSMFRVFPIFPLTDERIDALVVRTSYPTTKIQNELSFKPRKHIPTSIADIIGAES